MAEYGQPYAPLSPCVWKSHSICISRHRIQRRVMSQPTQRCFCKTSSHSYAAQSLRGNLTLSNHTANFQDSVSRPSHGLNSTAEEYSTVKKTASNLCPGHITQRNYSLFLTENDHDELFVYFITVKSMALYQILQSCLAVCQYIL